MKLTLLSSVLLIVGALAGHPAHAQSAQLDVKLERIAGTLDVSSMPYLKEGKLSGCQLVFDAMVRDYSYRQGRFIKVPGAIGIMHSGGPETPFGTVVKVVVSEIAEVNGSLASTPSPPTRAYLIGPDYTTNLNSLASAVQSDVPGGLFSIFQMNPTLSMVIEAMKTSKITIAFNQMGGNSDIRLPLDLDVVAPGRSGLHAERILQGFTGILQVDGYAGYNRLVARDRIGPNIQLAYCWAHARRKLVEITRNGSAPIAEEGVRRIGELYRIETELRGLPADARLAGRQSRLAPLIADMRTWLTHHRARVAGKSPLGEALAYIAKHWDGLCIFLGDGRIEIDNNTVERTIRPIALNRKNALFAGHDAGAENWATIASLIETCKLNAVDPLAYLTATLASIANGHKQSRIRELMPWNYAGRTAP